MPDTRGVARKSASKAPAATPAKAGASGNVRKTTVEVASTKPPGRAGSGRKTGASKSAVATLAQSASRAEKLTEEEVLADSRSEKERPEGQEQDQGDTETSKLGEADETPKSRISPKLLAALVKSADKGVRAFDPKLDVSNWIHHFEDITRNLPEDEKFGIFRNKMSAGSCFDWFVSRHREMAKMTVSQWLAKLETSFASDPLRRKNELRNRKQREGEEASDFIRDIDTLCIRYMPKMTVLDKIGYISDNVNPKYAFEFARISTHDRTLHDVELSLRNAMRVSGLSDRRPVLAGAAFTVGAEEHSGKSEGDTGRKNRSKPCFECGKPGHLAAKCYQRTAKMLQEN